MGITSKYIPTEGIPDFFVRERCIYLIGNKSQLQNTRQDIEDRINVSGRKYDVVIHNSIGKSSLADYIGGNVLCPQFDVWGKTRGYLVADSGDWGIVDTAIGLIEESIQNQQHYLEDLLLAAAFNNPVEFDQVVESVFGNTKTDDDTDSDYDNHNDGALFRRCGLICSRLSALFSPQEEDDDEIDGDTDSHSDSGRCFNYIFGLERTNDADITSGSERYFSNADISSKNKKEFLKHIPEKVSERYIKKNPNCRKDLEALTASVSYEDLQQLVLELITRHKGAIEIFDFSKLSAASEYELIVKKWGKTIKGYDSKFHYCIFLKDGDGAEHPLRFKHHPSYCLYLMYVIDRAVRGNEASYLSIRNNKDSYIRLYQAVFGDPYDEAEKKYLTFAYRLTKEGEISRKGRYDDYLRDIDSTITELVGRADSIPLKLRDGGHLELLPERITIDENLRIFNFK